MAGHAGHGGGGVDGRFPKEVQAQLGLLVISIEQCAVDRLGMARQGLCPDRFTGVPRGAEHQGREKKRTGGLTQAQLRTQDTEDRRQI